MEAAAGATGAAGREAEAAVPSAGSSAARRHPPDGRQQTGVDGTFAATLACPRVLAASPLG